MAENEEDMRFHRIGCVRELLVGRCYRAHNLDPETVGLETLWRNVRVLCDGRGVAKDGRVCCRHSTPLCSWV